jgi:cation:H+ antiporter
MLTAFLLLIIGLVVLIVAGDIMVRGAAALARHWGVPALIVGLTIVAFGTSAPEMVVGVQAALMGEGDLAAGNVVGSNIANVLLALGLPALILAIPTNMSGVARNSCIALFAAILFVFLAFIHTPLMRWQGAILFGGIIAYLFFMFRLAKAGADDPILEEMTEIDEGEDGLPTNTLKSFIYVVLGVIGLILGGKLIVDNAVFIAEGLGISKTIIGNVLGSNVFNVFAVMGASALAGPIAIESNLVKFDFWVMLLSSLVLLLYVLRRQPIGRKTGVVLTIAYAVYLAVVVFLAPNM